MHENLISVLLVDDNAADARRIRDVLEEGSSREIKLEHSTRLETALARLDVGGIDVVLLNLSLPDSQGIDTLTQTRMRSPHVPIIVLTDVRHRGYAAATLKAGGQDYLSKG